jgi:hypothetical protein
MVNAKSLRINQSEQRCGGLIGIRLQRLFCTTFAIEQCSIFTFEFRVVLAVRTTAFPWLTASAGVGSHSSRLVPVWTAIRLEWFKNGLRFIIPICPDFNSTVCESIRLCATLSKADGRSGEHVMVASDSALCFGGCTVTGNSRGCKTRWLGLICALRNDSAPLSFSPGIGSANGARTK